LDGGIERDFHIAVNGLLTFAEDVLN